MKNCVKYYLPQLNMTIGYTRDFDNLTKYPIFLFFKKLKYIQ